MLKLDVIWTYLNAGRRYWDTSSLHFDLIIKEEDAQGGLGDHGGDAAEPHYD